MVLNLTSLFEFAAAFAIVVFIYNWFRQDQHHDDGPLKPVRIPVTARKSRRNRR